MNTFFYGLGASEGEFEGTAKVLNTPEDQHKVEAGDIVIVYSSSPAWTIALLKASALISEVGGIICHTAIVSRELGIPCIVGVENVTKLIKDGDKLKINGKNGTIERI